MHMAGHELGKGVGYGNNGFVKVSILHAGGAPECASTGHVAARGGGFGAINRHSR